MERIVSVEEVPEGGTFVFRVRNGIEDTPVDEAILTRIGDDIHGWINRCQHWTDVRLDDGEGVETRNGEIICEKHGAYFEMDTGYCNYGPCEGSRLPSVEVEVRDGEVYLADDDCEFVGVGPMEEDEEEKMPQGTRGGDDFEL
ncbi:MAG: Rieske 2Fe-2S domain-containing protein [Halobacteriales archaeon]|nr:Rieske 2Fe-2S domain-containing protein [Halobacteriales archaeon]